MPGFNITGVSSGPDAKLDFFTSYNWYIQKLGPIESQKFLMHAKELTLPSIEFDEETVQGASVTYKFPKAIKNSDITVVFYDVYGVYKQLSDWFNTIWNNAAEDSNGIRPAEEFMSESIFYNISTNRKDQVVHVAKNTWPKSISHSNLSYENSEFKLITVVLSTSHIDVQHTVDSGGYAGEALAQTLINMGLSF